MEQNNLPTNKCGVTIIKLFYDLGYEYQLLILLFIIFIPMYDLYEDFIGKKVASCMVSAFLFLF